MCLPIFATSQRNPLEITHWIKHPGGKIWNSMREYVLFRFPTIFSDTLPKDAALLSPFRIEIDRDAKLVRRNYRPPAKNAEILKQTTELQKLTIIEHSNAAHYSQVILAPRPHTNKTEWRFCIDYRFLNDLTSSLSWPLPNIKQMFERLGARKANYFAAMDFTQGFHQIAMDKASAVLTAFITFCGNYQFTRVPFGPKMHRATINSL